MTQGIQKSQGEKAELKPVLRTGSDMHARTHARHSQSEACPRRHEGTLVIGDMEIGAAVVDTPTRQRS